MSSTLNAKKTNATHYLSAGINLSADLNYNSNKNGHIVGGELSYFTTDLPTTWLSFWGIYADYLFINESRNFRISIGPEIGYVFQKSIFLTGIDGGILFEKQEEKTLTGANLRVFFAAYSFMVFYRQTSLRLWGTGELGLLFKVPIPLG